MRIGPFDNDGGGRGIGGSDMRNFQCDELPRFIRRAVNGNDLVVVMHKHGGIDAGLGNMHSPDWFAGKHIDADHRAIAGGGIKDATAILPTEIRLRKGIVHRALAGSGRPDEFAGLLVESVKTIGGGAVAAPIGRDAAGDDEILINHWRGGAAVRKSEPAIFLHQRMLPEYFAVRIKGGEDALRSLNIDIARFAIHGRAGGAVTQINRVTEKIVEKPPPEFLARLGVVTDDALLQIFAFAEIAHDVELAVGDDGRGLPGEIGDP